MFLEPIALYMTKDLYEAGDGKWLFPYPPLDQAIAQVAKAIPGYLGEEAWENPSTGLVSNVYYWESMASLQALMAHPAHLAADGQNRVDRR